MTPGRPVGLVLRSARWEVDRARPHAKRAQRLGQVARPRANYGAIVVALSVPLRRGHPEAPGRVRQSRQATRGCRPVRAGPSRFAFQSASGQTASYWRSPNTRCATRRGRSGDHWIGARLYGDDLLSAASLWRRCDPCLPAESGARLARARRRRGLQRRCVPVAVARRAAARFSGLHGRAGPCAGIVVYSWDPLEDEELVRYQLNRLRRLLDRHEIGLTIIHLPEHPLSRAEYDPVFYDRYRGVIAEELPEANIIDLWQVRPTGLSTRFI